MNRILLCSTLLTGSVSLAANTAADCEAVVAKAGSITAKAELPLHPTPACLDQIAAALKTGDEVLQVTVWARVPDADRVGGKAWSEAQKVADALRSRVPGVTTAAVAIRGETKEPSALQVSYVRKLPPLPFARVEWAIGAVRGIEPLAPGGMLRSGAEVQTSAAGGAAILLDDGTRLLLEPDTRISMKAQDERGRPRALEVSLLSGAVHLQLPMLEEGASAVVTRGAMSAGLLPGATAQAPCRLRMTADGEGARVQAFSGVVGVRSEAAQVVLAAGEGARAEAAGLKKVSPIAEPPQTMAANSAAPSFSPVAGATGYAYELASETGFAKDVRFAQAGKSWPPTALPAGQWFWRVRAVDADGFLGAPSKARSFNIAAPPVVAKLPAEAGVVPARATQPAAAGTADGKESTAATAKPAVFVVPPNQAP